MSQFYVAGPSRIFTGTGVANALEFLGYCESAVPVTEIATFEDVYADYAGLSPADVQFMGLGGAIVGVTLVRYNEAILNKVLARYKGGTIGQTGSGDIGGLMIQESGSFRLVVHHPYISKAGMSTMRGCIDCGAAYMPDDYTAEYGTRVKRPRFNFRVLPVHDPNTLTSVLYSTVVPTLPAIN